MDKRACADKDPEIFFPEKGHLQLANEAIMTCFNCPVRQECKEYRKESGSDYGVWGGELRKRGEKDE